MGTQKQQTLAIIGAGPKAVAIAAKASVLKKLGFATPRIIFIEKKEVAHHWRASSYLTNGNLLLGTSPEKDVGFPYYSFCWGDQANQRVNFLMQQYSFQNFLVSQHLYADWIDRGSPAPSHHRWAEYLTWVFHHVEKGIQCVWGEATEVDIQDGGWKIKVAGPDNTAQVVEADGLVVTGPGVMRLPFDVPDHERIFDHTKFWKNSSELSKIRNKHFALVGAGENSATIAVALGQADPSVQVDVISPSATTYTRGESYVENHLYTDPFQGNWLKLTKKDRQDFILRTDRGVFSVATKRQLDQLQNVEMLPGLCRGVRIDGLDQILVNIEYNNDREERVYDYVILAVGFSQSHFISTLLTPNAKEILANKSGINDWTNQEIEDRIDENLAVQGSAPVLHLPMLAGLTQGPGFANLSCLGRLSDHILARYVRIGAYPILGAPLPVEMTDSEMGVGTPYYS